MDVSLLRFDASSELPLYQQLANALSALVEKNVLLPGEKLPPTRNLAGQLGLNRTTVSAAYNLLEEAGLIEGQVGRGSYVAERKAVPLVARRDWESILPPVGEPLHTSRNNAEISFASSRPDGDEFPLAEFRRLSKQVIDGPHAGEILQLGSSRGYGPLRRYLLERALEDGIARPGDDLIVTNGCQQALDLVARLFTSAPCGVVLEDPVYHGVLRVFARTGATVWSVPVGATGVDPDALESLLQAHRPRLVVLTPSFQNPTGTTLSLIARRRVVEMTERYGCVLVENDIYSDLRYTGSPLPSLKALDESGNTILLRSYSKVCFPGLRVGWVIAPRPVIARLAEAKEISDLHSDQLSQAVLLRFAESGELARHLERTRQAGRERLAAALGACERYLPAGARFTKPQGGMSLWVELPQPLLAETLLPRVEEEGVSFIPGRHFSARRAHARSLRISFGSLTPQQITRGIRILGEAARRELALSPAMNDMEPAPALV